jgi:hypothetical protein
LAVGRRSLRLGLSLIHDYGERPFAHVRNASRGREKVEFEMKARPVRSVENGAERSKEKRNQIYQKSILQLDGILIRRHEERTQDPRVIIQGIHMRWKRQRRRYCWKMINLSTVKTFYLACASRSDCECEAYRSRDPTSLVRVVLRLTTYIVTSVVLV